MAEMAVETQPSVCASCLFFTVESLPRLSLVSLDPLPPLDAPDEELTVPDPH